MYQPKKKNAYEFTKSENVNPAKRNVLVVKNETRILEQKRKVIQKFQ